ncbi:hypothetical protein [Roseovarius sp. M141]|uniref:hypothetical protein n=1 Tax=Roseovarius sp. M141 TaxID=2583806 RepID=UPI0020CDF102|nr:hypothetical protein [Roseovarius sp. M141]
MQTATVLKIIILFGLVLGVLYWTVHDPGVNAEGSARTARLEELKAQLSPTEQESVIWAPWLVSESYAIGTVFAGEGYAQAYSGACDNVNVKQNPLSLKLGANQRYKVDAETAQPLAGQLSVDGAKAIEYKVSFSGAELALANRELLEQMYADTDCLAAIANRQVLVLYGRYSGAEEYKLSRSWTANLSLDKIFEKFGVKGSGQDDSTFTREGTLIWALTKVHFKDEVNFAGDLSDGDRKLLVKDLMLNESNDYVPIALAQTDLSVPSEADLNKLTSALETAAN